MATITWIVFFIIFLMWNNYTITKLHISVLIAYLYLDCFLIFWFRITIYNVRPHGLFLNSSMSDKYIILHFIFFNSLHFLIF
jgi:hypothetical protein